MKSAPAWIDYKGDGEPPCSVDKIAAIKIRSGEKLTREVIDFDNLDWTIDNGCGDIIQYCLKMEYRT